MSQHHDDPLDSLFILPSRVNAIMTNTNKKQIIHVLVIAHPDDESMFFLPTIKSLINSGETVWLLCLTTGDYDGLGVQRQQELYKAGNLLGIDKVIIKDEMKDHPSNRWPIKKVSSLIQTTLLAEENSGKKQTSSHRQRFVLITFDSLGVSGHCNHVDTFLGVCDVVQNTFNNNNNNKEGIPIVQEAWTLESERNIIRKYFPIQSWILALLSIFNSKNSNVIQTLHQDNVDRRVFRWNEPILNWRAMATHESQFVWYRRLFVIFSCYTYINKLHRIRQPKIKEG